MKWEYIIRHRTVNLNELGGEEWELCSAEEDWYTFKRPMKCKNCKFYKTKLVSLRYGQVLYKSCIEGNLPENWDGCEKFKSKDYD